MCNKEKLIEGERNEREDFKFWFGMTERDAGFCIRLENTHPASERSREKPAFPQPAPPLPAARQDRSAAGWREAACAWQQPPRHQRPPRKYLYAFAARNKRLFPSVRLPEFPLLPPQKKANEKHLPGGRKAVCCCNCMLARACWYWKIPVLKTAVAPLVFSSAGLFGNGGSTAWGIPWMVDGYKNKVQ